MVLWMILFALSIPILFTVCNLVTNLRSDNEQEHIAKKGYEYKNSPNDLSSVLL